MDNVSVTSTIAVDPDRVYALVSDITRMGQWSPENTSCRWLGGASGPAVAARFRGSNKRGVLRWSTTCTVTTADPGRRFAFSVTYGPTPIADWAYDFSATAEGTQVTESWVDRRPGWMRIAGAVAMALPDRGEHNRTTMTATLAALKRAAESASSPG